VALADVSASATAAHKQRELHSGLTIQDASPARGKSEKKGFHLLLSKNTGAAEKIIANIKGLRNHLQEAEQPIMTIPAIWDGGQSNHSIPCDVVLTEQRLLGYSFTSFPRERLFLDALTLSDITSVSLRQKTFEPIFRELMVSDDRRKVYIRAPRQKIETLYSALRLAIESYAPIADPIFSVESTGKSPRPIFGRQEIRKPFESSPLAISLLFSGGLALEVIGATLWAATHSSQVGMPLCVAGFVAVLLAIVTRRQAS